MSFVALLSPAKTLDLSPVEVGHTTRVRAAGQTDALVAILRQRSPGDLQDLMHISEALAELNYQRFQEFGNGHQAKPALLAFKGDVYTGLDAETLTEPELAFAQDHVRILSGLYGLLRPLDLIQPYRLEMGTRLPNPKGKNLYEFWGDTLTELLNEDIRQIGHTHVLNLASKEYFSSLRPEKLIVPVIHIHFKELRNGNYRVISFNAKKARGAMAGAIVRDGITDPEALQSISVEGYVFHADLSDERNWTFTK